MGTTLNRHAFERLIKEDLDWLLKQPRTLERDHIEMILKGATKLHYGPINDELQAAYTQGCSDTKRGAVAALQAIDNIRGASEWPIIYKQDALKAVEQSSPISATRPERAGEENEQ